ncbi:MAG: hypothetical protein IJH52_00070 [Oscillospiraceae bacterium]|nr:hypothetical protein [Oscillospiraceae bacterium]
MKEKLQNWKEDIKNALCIIGGVTVVCGAVFAVVKLCSKKEQKKSKKKK